MFGAVGTRASACFVLESPAKRKLSGGFYAGLLVLAFTLPGQWNPYSGTPYPSNNLSPLLI